MMSNFKAFASGVDSPSAAGQARPQGRSMRFPGLVRWRVLLSFFLILGCATTATMPQSAEVTSDPNSAITIIRGGEPQFELIGSTGIRVLVDVAVPFLLSRPPGPQDILLTTHGHEDHVNWPFVESFPGQQLRIREGSIVTKQVSIRGIASAHSTPETMKTENGSNYIFIIDMDGLRIVAFGDIGQDRLTDGQLKALGRVDIALMQFENHYADMNMTNLKGFHLMDQVKPRLIIPTHLGRGSAAYAANQWKGFVNRANQVQVSRAKLPPQETHLLLLGEVAHKYAEDLNLAEW